ncbi:hypothetical protein AB3R30_13835 [Leptolyngbyaceae cyanobacterium UHCC 1019]
MESRYTPGSSAAPLQEIKAQVVKLSISERLELMSAIVQSLQVDQAENWQYLESRSHAWRQQLYLKGRKLLAAIVWQDMMANQLSSEQAAENWSLPLAAIDEVIRYCDSHQELLKLEAAEERNRLAAGGVSLELTTTAG